MKTALLALAFSALAFAQAAHSNVLSWTIALSPTSDPVTTLTLQSAPPCSTSGCTGAGVFTTIATLAPTVTSYTDSTPKAGQQTYYQIQASNLGGMLTSNAIVLVTPFLPPTGSVVLSGASH